MASADAPFEQQFRAMGSDIHLIVVGGSEGLVGVARERIEQLESRWSRFRPDSEVSALNSAPGEALPVSADTQLLVERAIEAWRITGGAYDPTLLDAIEMAGYDRSFDELARDRPEPVQRHPTVKPRTDLSTPVCTDIVVHDGTITIPVGLGFDPGGIGKGLAADLVAEQLMAAGARGACVNMGGDARVIGESPSGDGWTLAIEHPWSATPIALVGIRHGAVATSSVLRRVWTIGGSQRHHLIDPNTLEPTTSDLALASVIAGEAWLAEVHAKAVLLRGSARAFDLLDVGCAGLIVDRSGSVTSSFGFEEFLGGVTLTDRVEQPVDQ